MLTRDFAHAPERAQAVASGPGTEQRGGQRREADRQPDQLLHALQEMLVVGDVEDQGQFGRSSLAGVQRCIEEPVGGCAILQADQSGLGGQFPGQSIGAVEPRLAVGALDFQGQVGTQVDFVLQTLAQWLEVGEAVHLAQGAAQLGQAAIEQLLVKFDEVRFAGTVEQHAGHQ